MDQKYTHYSAKFIYAFEQSTAGSELNFTKVMQCSTTFANNSNNFYTSFLKI